MKISKYILSMILLLCVTGCSEKITCSKSIDGDVFSYDSTIEMKFNNNKLIKRTLTNDFHDKEIATSWYNMLSDSDNYEIKGSKIIVKNYEDELNDQTKKEILKFYKDDGYKCQ